MKDMKKEMKEELSKLVQRIFIGENSDDVFKEMDRLKRRDFLLRDLNYIENNVIYTSQEFEFESNLGETLSTYNPEDLRAFYCELNTFLYEEWNTGCNPSIYDLFEMFSLTSYNQMSYLISKLIMLERIGKIRLEQDHKILRIIQI